MLGCLQRNLPRGGRAVDPRTLNPRILKDSKKDIGGSSTGGLKDQTRHWRLEGLID